MAQRTGYETTERPPSQSSGFTIVKTKNECYEGRYERKPYEGRYFAYIGDARVARPLKGTGGLLERRLRSTPAYYKPRSENNPPQLVEEPDYSQTSIRLSRRGRRLTGAFLTLSAAGAGIFGAVIGIQRDRYDATFTKAEAEAAYGRVLAPLSERSRFTTEYLTGVQINNPRDGGTNRASASNQDPSDYESDEHFGRNCLAGTGFDIRPSSVTYGEVNAQAVIEPDSEQPGNRFSVVSATGVRINFVIADRVQPMLPATNHDVAILVQNNCSDVPSSYEAQFDSTQD